MAPVASVLAPLDPVIARESGSQTDGLGPIQALPLQIRKNSPLGSALFLVARQVSPASPPPPLLFIFVILCSSLDRVFWPPWP